MKEGHAIVRVRHSTMTKRFIEAIPKSYEYNIKNKEWVNGIIQEPHLTLQSHVKIDDKEKWEKQWDAIEGNKLLNKSSYLSGEISFFDNDEEDYVAVVIKLKTNLKIKKLRELLFNLYPADEKFEYNPHVTIGYFKKEFVLTPYYRNLSCSPIVELKGPVVFSLI